MTLVDELLRRYIDAIDSGFGFIGGDVRWLLSALIIINLTLAALMWALSAEEAIAALARRVLYIGFFVWLVDNWPLLTDIIARSFTLLGLRAGGGTGAENLLAEPGAVAERGLIVISPMLQLIRELSGPVATFENFPEIVLLLVAVALVLTAFFVIAIQIVFAILVFKLGALIAFTLVPFALLNKTAFISERPFGWVVGAGLRLMALTLVLGIGERMFGQLELPVQAMTVYRALDIALAALVLMLLSLLASRLASDLASGSPRLGVLDAGLALAGTTAAATYAGRRGAAALGAAGRATRSIAQQATSALQSTRTRGARGADPKAGA